MYSCKFVLLFWMGDFEDRDGGEEMNQQHTYAVSTETPVRRAVVLLASTIDGKLIIICSGAKHNTYKK